MSEATVEFWRDHARHEVVVDHQFTTPQGCRVGTRERYAADAVLGPGFWSRPHPTSVEIELSGGD